MLLKTVKLFKEEFKKTMHDIKKHDEEMDEWKKNFNEEWNKWGNKSKVVKKRLP